MVNWRSAQVVVAAMGLVLFSAAGCKKAKPLPPPSNSTAPVVTAPAPTADISASPTVVSAGDTVTLSWHTTDATDVTIEGVGPDAPAGTKQVIPSVSTSYHLIAKGPGGTTDATTRVTVNASPVVSVPGSTVGSEEEFRANVQDIFFDYDAYDVRGDQQSVVSKDANYLNTHSDVRVVIGGYCDERGSNEYNLALGQNRGDAAKSALVAAGVAPGRIRVVSYGKEKPFCTESTEECWQQNRRAGFQMER